MSQSSNATGMASSVELALDAFRRGEPVCVHDADDREGETDLIYPAGRSHRMPLPECETMRVASSVSH